jgi:hypothetical protein
MDHHAQGEQEEGGEYFREHRIRRLGG